VSSRGEAASSRQAVEEALRAIGALFEPNDVIEIRALNVGGTSRYSGVTISGYFNLENGPAIAKAVQELDGRAEGIYVVLNRVHPALLARANNRLQPKPKHTTSDTDIIERCWLYIDADPVRPAGISSTDEEHEAALNRANEIREFLSAQGWPAPLYADSGNGAHLLYRLPALELARAGDLVKRCLKALAVRFSDDHVKVDESTANAARICKLYGTPTRKGDATPDRPHRRSHLIDYPERLEPVSVEALEALAAEVARGSPAPKGTSHHRSNIDDWIQAAGLDVVNGPEPYSGGRKWTLRTCAFNPEHERPVIIEMANGARVYRCLHNSCRENDWRAFRRQVAPGDADNSSEGSGPQDSTEGDPNGHEHLANS
jgi:hypothetical protein